MSVSDGLTRVTDRPDHDHLQRTVPGLVCKAIEGDGQLVSVTQTRNEHTYPRLLFAHAITYGAGDSAPAIKHAPPGLPERGTGGLSIP